MKKLIASFLALMLMLGGSLSLVSAEEAKNNYDWRVFEENDFISRAVEKDGKIYGLGSALFEIDVANKSVVKLADQGSGSDYTIVDLFLSDGKELMGFSLEKRELFKLNITEGLVVPGEILHSFEDIEGEADFGFAYESAIINDVFYFLFNDSMKEEDSKLYSYNLNTKEEKLLNIDRVYRLGKYKDGRMFIGRLEGEGETTNFEILDFDQQTGETKLIASLGSVSSWKLPRVFYNSQKDSLYIMQGAEIQKIAEDGSLETVAYINRTDHNRTNSFEIGDKQVFILRDSEPVIAVRTLDPKDKPERVLTVVGNAGEVLNIASRMPDTPIISKDRVWDTPQALAQGFISAGDSFDIMQLELSTIDLKNLIQKGYVAAIESESIKAFMQNVPEVLKNEISMDGKLYALVTESDIKGFRYNKPAFEKLGLNVPKSYLELLKLYYEVETGDSENKADYSFSINPETFKDIYATVRMYVLSQTANEKEIVFNTPEFKELIAQTKANSKLQAQELDWEDDDEVDEFFSKENLIEEISVSSPRYLSDYDSEGKRRFGVTLPLKMGAFEGDEANISLTSRVYIINSRSKNIDLALKFLETRLELLSESEKAGILLKIDAPIKNPRYDYIAEVNTAEYNRVKAKADSLEGAEKEAYLEENGYILEHLDEILEESKFEVDEDQLKIFTDFVDQKAVLETVESLIYVNDTVLTYDLIERYMQDQINEDMFAGELDNKARLVKLEQQ